MVAVSAETEDSLATRPSLLARLKDWNQQTAWGQFDADYAPLLRNVARKAGLTDTEADEVVQETLLAVARKIGEFDHAGRPGSFRAWLYQQARWRIADQFRARCRSRPMPAPTEPLQQESQHDGGRPLSGGFAAAEPPSHPGPADGVPSADPAFERLWNEEWETHLRQTVLDRVKRQVSARQFQLFDLHALQGLPVRAAAQAAGASIAAVYMAKSRVARLLRRESNRLRDSQSG